MTVNEQIHTVISATVLRWQADVTPSIQEMEEKWGGYEAYIQERKERHTDILMEELEKAGFMLIPKSVASLLCKECEAFINQKPQS